MRTKESLTAVAMSFIKGMTGNIVKELLSRGYGPEDVFGPHSATIDGLGWLREINMAEVMNRAEEEFRFMERHHITPIFLDSPEYPTLLAESGNPPVVLYMLGETNLNAEHSLSIVGTRKSTPIGNNFCDKLTKEIARDFPETLIVSGLAYGIDAAAHNGALKHGLPTVGVLAHGLDMIYPAAHRGLASMMIQNGGGLITEYPRGTRPHRNHFLERNRIVATMTEGVVLAESPVKGGAMSTASIAFSYSREVMAVPGRPSDINSQGCNLLIKTNKAHLLESYADLCDVLGWQTINKQVTTSKTLFPELDGDTKNIYEFLAQTEVPQTMDAIASGTQLSIVKVMTLLTDMEFDGLVIRHPGNRFTPGI